MKRQRQLYRESGTDDDDDDNDEVEDESGFADVEEAEVEEERLSLSQSRKSRAGTEYDDDDDDEDYGDDNDDDDDGGDSRPDERDAPWNQYAWLEEMHLRVSISLALIAIIDLGFRPYDSVGVLSFSAYVSIVAKQDNLLSSISLFALRFSPSIRSTG